MRFSSIRPSLVRLCAKGGPATSISPARSAFSSRIAPSRSSSTSLALGPTDFNERETTHFGWFRHAAAKARSSRSERASCREREKTSGVDRVLKEKKEKKTCGSG